MRVARVVTTLVLAAHGSEDRRSAANARAVATRIRFMRPGLRVRVAFCELDTPRLANVLTPGAVVTPFLLADAYHARIDIPRQIASCGVAARQADVLGADDRLVAVLRDRLDAFRGQRAHRAGRPQADGKNPMGWRDNRVRDRLRSVGG